MSIILRLHKVCNECGFIWYPKDEAVSSNCPNCASENTANEKFNFIATVLFYFIGLVVLVLVLINLNSSTEPSTTAIEPLSAVADSLTKTEEQIEMPTLEEESDDDSKPIKPLPPAQPSLIENPESIIAQTEVAPPPLSISEAPIIPIVEPAPVEDLRPKNTISSDQISFSLWSVSELRLRRAYTNLLNDGSSRAEFNKKEYLHFVGNRAKKCGDLDPSFEKNINSIENIKFKENDAKVLECYASENTSEYNRLNISVDEGFN